MARTPAQGNLEAELGQYLAYWKDRLGLQSWTITIRSSDRLSDLDNEAEAHIVWSRELANILVESHGSYSRSKYNVERDVEATVVHELLHCLLQPIQPAANSGLSRDLYEQLVERLSRALVGARRDAPNQQ